VFARTYRADGTPLTGEFRINASISGSQGDPSIAWISPTQFVVAWSGQGQGDAQNVFARVFRDNGTPVTNEIRVPQTRAGAKQSAVAIALPEAAPPPEPTEATPEFSSNRNEIDSSVVRRYSSCQKKVV
jgi:hypothetical protein